MLMWEYLSRALGFDDHVVVDPLRNRQPADPFDERREVFGRDAELAGIESHAAFGAVVLAQQVRELLEVLLGPVVYRILYFGMLREVVVEDVPDLVDRRGDQPVDDVVREMGLLAPGFTLDLRDETAYRVAFLVRERQAGVGRELQEKLEQVFCVDVDAAQEIGRNDDYVGPEILLRLDLEDILRAEDEDRIFLQPVFVQVERYAGLPFRADADDEGVDAAREPGKFPYGCRCWP